MRHEMLTQRALFSIDSYTKKGTLSQLALPLAGFTVRIRINGT